ncbi:hypothetical protein IPdc08_00966 [archaeon]|nr:hypothetical protein IPdc08_00966 [archaeon]
MPHRRELISFFYDRHSRKPTTLVVGSSLIIPSIKMKAFRKVGKGGYNITHEVDRGNKIGEL